MALRGVQYTPHTTPRGSLEFPLGTLEFSVTRLRGVKLLVLYIIFMGRMIGYSICGAGIRAIPEGIGISVVPVLAA